MLEALSEDVGAWRDRLLDRSTARHLVWHRNADAARAAAGESVSRVADDSSLVTLRSGSREVGWCWLGREGADLVVLDLELLSASDVEGVRDWLVARTLSEGLVGLRAAAYPDDPLARPLVDDPRFSLLTTNMVLELPEGWTARLPETPGVRLEPMTERQFADYLSRAVETYAEERQAAGEPPEEAQRIAVEQTARLLPEGRDSPGHHLFTVHTGAEEIGILWLATSTPVVFVYDIEIDPGRRGRGWGSAVMDAAARWSAERGAPALGLNVFSHNDRARSLYDRLGYRVVVDHFRADLARR